MENIYTPPNSVETNECQLLTWKKVLSSIFSVISATVYFLGYWLTPYFAEMYANFGVELPFQTIFLIELHPYLLLLSIMSFLPMVVWHQSELLIKVKYGMFRISFIHFIISIVEIAFLLWSLYAPIYALGQSV
ncbi:hypothetical protein ACJJIE_14520 [Microbulbifer sp. TRSA001]|uniref:hypothetical protein n=1 Tax=Microbulbifer sp. TRSA001 TaxID=3243381 RepID=UPI004039E528